MALKSVQLGMIFNNAVASTIAEGKFSPDDVQARIFEYAQILETAAAELGVDLESTSYDSGSGGFEQKPTKGVRFQLDGQTWFDYRQAKEDGKVKDTFPDFKNYETNEGIYINDLDGEPNEEAQPLVAAADVVNALA